MLYHYVCDFGVEYQRLHDLGFIATCVWDPTLDVRIPVEDGGEHHTVTVQAGRLARGREDAAHVILERLTFPNAGDRNLPPTREVVARSGD